MHSKSPKNTKMILCYFKKNKLNGGGKNYSAYLFLFILTLLQCFYFLVAETDAFQTKILFTLSTFVFYVLLGSFSKKLLNIFIVFSFLVTCFVFPVVKIYGAIDYGFVMSVFYTNTAEAFSYMKIVDGSIYIPLILLGIYTFFLVKKIQKINLNNWIKLIFLLLLLALPLRKIFIPFETKLHRYFYILPINKVVKSYVFYKETQKEYNYIKKESTKPSSWKIVSKPNKTPNKNIVVVIGESVRKDFLHSYGFPIENTPFI